MQIWAAKRDSGPYLPPNKPPLPQVLVKKKQPANRCSSQVVLKRGNRRWEQVRTTLPQLKRGKIHNPRKPYSREDRLILLPRELREGLEISNLQQRTLLKTKHPSLLVQVLFPKHLKRPVKLLSPNVPPLKKNPQATMRSTKTISKILAVFLQTATLEPRVQNRRDLLAASETLREK